MAFEEVLRFVYEVTGNKELTEAAKAVLSVGDATEETANAVQALAEEFAKAQSGRDAIQTYTKTAAALNEVGDKLTIAKAKVAELSAAQQTSTNITGASSRELRNAEKAVDGLSRQQGTLETQLTRSNVALQKAGIETTGLAAADAKLAGDIDNVNKRLGTLASETDKAGAGAGRLSKLAETVGGAFTGAVGAVGAFVGKLAAITGVAGAVGSALGVLNVGRFFGGAIDSAKTLQSALAEVAAVSGAGADQLARMKDSAEQASATTKFTALEATQALGELARASGDADQAMAQLPATLNLAQAAGIGASEAATLLTTTITQFGLEATDATRVADLFSKEANTTNDTVTGLGLAMSYVAPLAKQLGASVEDTTALIGALADQGFRGERAGTALRNVMSQLLDPTSKFSAELRGLGITSTDFNTVILELAAAGDKGKQALLALDAQARPAIASLVNSGGAGITKLSEALKGAAGDAKNTSDIMGATFETASKRFGGALDFIRRSLVDPIFEPLSAQLDGATTRIRAFADTTSFKKLAASIKDFAVQGAASLVEFVSKIDVDAVANKVSGVVDSLKEFVKEARDSVGSIVGYFNTATNVVAGTYNAFTTVVHSAAVAIAGSAGIALKALALLAKADYNTEIQQKMAGIKTSSEELNDAANALFESAETNYEQTGAAAGALAANLEALSKAATETGDAAEKSAPKISLSGKAAEEAAARALHAAEGFDYLTGKGTDLGNELQLIPDYLRPFGLGMDAGAASTSKLGDAAELAEAKAKALTGALTDLGLKSQAELREAAAKAAAAVEIVTASRKANGAEIEDQIRVVAKWAEAERAASAQSSEAQKAATEAKIAAKIAALGLTDQIKATGAAGAAAGAQISAGMAQGKASVDGLTSSAREAQGTIVKMAEDTTTTVGDLVYELNKANTSYDSLGEAGKAAFDKVVKAQESGAGGVTGVIAAMNNDWAAYFAGISEGAANAFKSVQQSALGFANDTSLSLGAYLGALSDGASALKARIAEQKVAVDDLIGGFAKLDASAAGNLQQTIGSLEYMKRELEANRAQLDLLDKASVDKLNASIKGVEQRLQAVRDSATAARNELASTASDIQDQLDQQDGKAKELEERRYARQRQQIVDLGIAKGVQNTKEYQDALANAEELHKRKLAAIVAEAAASAASQSATANAARESAAATSSDADAAERAAAARERSAAAAAAVASSTSPASSSSPGVSSSTLTVRFEGMGGVSAQSIDLSKLTEAQKADVARLLTPYFIASMKDALRASGVSA